jgi:hypothetical protein
MATTDQNEKSNISTNTNINEIPTNDTQINPPPIPRSNFTKFLIDPLKVFLKIYGVRIIYSLINILRNRKKFTFTFPNILKALFNLANLRTSVFVSALPVLYELFKKIIINIFTKKDSTIVTFISSFLSGFISILFEEKTNLLSYIVMSIFVRSAHSLLLVILKHYDILQNPGKLWDFAIFLVVALFMYTVNYLNPSYMPISKLFDNYANYVDKAEYEEMIRFRESMRIV